MIYLQTPRLIVRDHINADLQPMYLLLGNPQNMYFIMDLYTPDESAAQENLKIAMDAQNEIDRKQYFFAIIDKLSGTYIGEIGFTVLESPLESLSYSEPRETTKYAENSRIELGYFIKTEFWSQGIVTEAARVVIQYAFEILNVHKIMTGCAKENKGSENVMIKLGFVKEGELKAHQWIDGQWRDRVIYGYLNDQYRLYQTSK